jgi:ABC-type phosphate transport system ATPase subunit
VRRLGGPAVAARILAAVVEVLACRRPLHHLAAWATQDVLARIARLDEQPTAVRSVRVSEPAAGVAEATAVLTRGTRVVAAAARFEAVEGRWLCTALDLL